MLPPGWQAAPRFVNGEQIAADLIEIAQQPLGTDFPYGCGWCGRSLKYDEVEMCEQLMRTVHAECHDAECGATACSYLTCTEERCISQDECEGCYQMVCKRHGLTDCAC